MATPTEWVRSTVIDEFGVDGFRYYVLADTTYGQDGDFTYEGLTGRYNSDLANNLGNLAARGVGMSRLLIVALTRLLATEGVRWVGFTGTPALINSFRRLGIVLHGLAPADPRRLGVDREQWRADWGTYYDAGPQVMVAEVPGADRTLATAGTYRRFGAQEATHGLCA